MIREPKRARRKVELRSKSFAKRESKIRSIDNEFAEREKRREHDEEKEWSLTTSSSEGRVEATEE